MDVNVVSLSVSEDQWPPLHLQRRDFFTPDDDTSVCGTGTISMDHVAQHCLQPWSNMSRRLLTD